MLGRVDNRGKAVIMLGSITPLNVTATVMRTGDHNKVYSNGGRFSNGIRLIYPAMLTLEDVQKLYSIPLTRAAKRLSMSPTMVIHGCSTATPPHLNNQQINSHQLNHLAPSFHPPAQEDVS